MSREYEPEKGHWYEDLDRAETFRVVSIDPDDGLVSIQWLDGEVEDLDLDQWNELDLEPVEEPEGWAEDEDDEELDEEDWDEDEDEDEDAADDEDDWDDDEEDDEDWDDDGHDDSELDEETRDEDDEAASASGPAKEDWSTALRGVVDQELVRRQKIRERQVAAQEQRRMESAAILKILDRFFQEISRERNVIVEREAGRLSYRVSVEGCSDWSEEIQLGETRGSGLFKVVTSSGESLRTSSSVESYLKVQLVPKIAARLAPLREAQAKEQQIARAGRLERYRVQQSTSVRDRSSIAELEARLRGRSWADIAKKNGPTK